MYDEGSELRYKAMLAILKVKLRAILKRYLGELSVHVHISYRHNWDATAVQPCPFPDHLVVTTRGRGGFPLALCRVNCIGIKWVFDGLWEQSIFDMADPAFYDKFEDDVYRAISNDINYKIARYELDRSNSRDADIGNATYARLKEMDDKLWNSRFSYLVEDLEAKCGCDKCKQRRNHAL